MLAEDRLQFDRTGFPPPEVPGWLHWISDAVRAMAPLLEIVFWAGLAVIVATVAWFIIRELLGLRLPRPKAETTVVAVEPEWRPDAGPVARPE